MLGIPDPWVAAAFLLCILSSVACVIYGLATWNRGEEGETREAAKKWAKAEDQMEEGL